MNVVISAFRDSVPYLGRYFSQIAGLREACGNLRMIAGEGDSTDGTRAALARLSAAFGIPLDLVAVDHGFEHFGSTESPTRLRELSKIGQAMLNAVTRDDEVVVYVESDLIWDAGTMAKLVQIVVGRTHGFDVVAPLVFAGKYFYDVWGFRKNDARFAPYAPYHSELLVGGFTEVDSVGSCLVMRSEVARAGNMGHEGLVGFCRSLRSQGFRIGVDSRLRIHHPC